MKFQLVNTLIAGVAQTTVSIKSVTPLVLVLPCMHAYKTKIETIEPCDSSDLEFDRGHSWTYK